MSEDSEFENEQLSERLEEQREEERLRKRREFLVSLSQEDRDFIARYGEEIWKKWKEITERGR